MAARIVPTVLDCGHAPRPEDVKYYSPGSYVTVGAERIRMTGDEVMIPGYGRDREDRTYCYPCMDRMQREDIETLPSVVVYDDGGPDVTTWTGGRLARVIGRSTYRNGLTGTRMTALTVRTPRGRVLHGRYGSDWSQAVVLRGTV